MEVEQIKVVRILTRLIESLSCLRSLLLDWLKSLIASRSFQLIRRLEISKKPFNIKPRARTATSR